MKDDEMMSKDEEEFARFSFGEAAIEYVKYMENLMSEFDKNQVETIKKAIDDVVEETNYSAEEYMDSDEFENKYWETDDYMTFVNGTNEAVDYGLEKFKEAWDKKEEFNVLGDKREEARDYTAKMGYIAKKLEFSEDVIPCYLNEIMDDLPRKLNEEKVNEIIKTFLDIYCEGMEELREPMSLRFMMELNSMHLYDDIEELGLFKDITRRIKKN